MHIIVPTRGRPQNVVRQMNAIQETCTHSDTRFLYCIDADDPSYNEYCDILRNKDTGPHARFTFVKCTVSKYISEIINGVSNSLVKDHSYIGFMGDDHLPRTAGWDSLFIDMLRQMHVGMVFGNDTIQGPNLPTHIVMTSNIIRTIGYMVPPQLHHLYLDNFWRDLGNRTNTIAYRSDVIIEHMHPIAKKAEWDDGYKRVNDGAMYEHDRTAYESYLLSERFNEDINNVLRLMSTND